MQATTEHTAATGKKLALASRLVASVPSQTAEDQLIDFRQVYALIGSACKTGHTARALARRGQIRAVRLSDRALRYSLQSVLALVAGRVEPVATSNKAA